MVIECKAEVGDEIKVDDTLVVLEAMKMMNSLNTKTAGVITEIKCETGDSVAKGDIVIDPKV